MSDCIVIAGKNEIACSMLKFIIENYNNYLIKVVLNKNETGIDDWQPSLKKLALSKNIQIILLNEVYNIKDCIFISCEFDRIIKPKLFNTKKLYNIHFSKLPEYKGMYTSCLPILHNKKETGVTLHKIDKGIDTGDIIDQYVFPICPEDTAYDLYLKYNKHGYELIKKNFKNLLQNNFKYYKQSFKNSSYYSKKSLDFKNINVDYIKTANEIKNQIHAYSFVYYQLPLFNNIKIIRAEVLLDKSIEAPKKIVKETNNYIIINTIDYNIKLFKYGV